ncbi:uncharacterized protein ATNIH1004_003818 [Aspergillus tanneri]|uniref:Uncharacterized protein n=1 Tax=Aspergillus tanneri TaxID=1220188 RepID=A0A5M9MPW5_9EURO|nr:uncharacterized protein ATNIH1004_003818 [Aspergillus tanneri]KAA8647936.1 hypothetical protein ATNIH1004_003818 [Aspergillus tanneri]
MGPKKGKAPARDESPYCTPGPSSPAIIRPPPQDTESEEEDRMEYVSRDQFRDFQTQLQSQMQTQMQQIMELIQRSQSPLSSTPTPNPKPTSTDLPSPREDDAGRASIIQAVSTMRKDVGRKLQYKLRSLKISNFADWKEDLLKDARIINAESILINKELNPPDSDELNSAI